MNLLIIEDEPELFQSISNYLSQSKFVCELAHDFQTAENKLSDARYDCIILDINLPGGSGLDLLKKIKLDNKEDGVLIISARGSLTDKVEGLELGADDYLTKPFYLAELSARVNAIIRRRAFAGNNCIQLDKLSIHIINKTVNAGQGDLDLTRKEYELLVYFASNKNRVVTKESILDHLWGDTAGMSDSYDLVYSHVKNLRKKLAEAGCPDYIRSIYGIGYRFAIA